MFKIYLKKISLILKGFYTQQKPLVINSVKAKDWRNVTCAVHAAQCVECVRIMYSGLFCNKCGQETAWNGWHKRENYVRGNLKKKEFGVECCCSRWCFTFL